MKIGFEKLANDTGKRMATVLNGLWVNAFVLRASAHHRPGGASR
jgi:hypothetical protein